MEPPLSFKVRTQGVYNGAKGGRVKKGFGGAGVLWYEDKTFTVAATQDQWLLASDSHGSLSLSLSLSDQSMIPTQPQGKPLRFLSVCSGMEAASIAFEPLGWKAVGFCEIDPYASAVLAHRFPNTPNYGDLTQHTQWPISNGDVDLLIGGPPCQAFSVAGLRRGLADPRGNLTLTYLGLVDRLRPEWVIYENVPGLLSVDGGRTFGTFLHALGQLGYGWAYRVLDAQHVGECRLHPHRRGWSAVPQRRRRIFVVARRGAGGWASAAEVLSLREGVQRHLAAGGKKRQGVAPDAGGGAEEGGLPRTVGTICADSHPGAYTGQDAYTGRLIPSHWEGSDIHPTLNACEHSGSPGYSNQELFSQKGAGLVPIPIQDGRDIEKHQNGLGVGKPGDPAYTVDTTGSQAAAISFQPGNLAPTIGASGPPYSRTGNERVEAEALAITMNIYGGNKRKDRPEGGMYVRPEDTSKCLDAANGLNPTCSQGGTAVLTLMAVRRLTPNECLRLQGFPDGWTNIPWKGKPEGQAPDGPQYKCAGNSFAVPVVRWIGTRIAAQP
jgi:DNA (cytosine-5)-methyltransferase 1